MFLHGAQGSSVQDVTVRMVDALAGFGGGMSWDQSSNFSTTCFAYIRSGHRFHTCEFSFESLSNGLLSSIGGGAGASHLNLQAYGGQFGVRFDGKRKPAAVQQKYNLH